MQNYDDLSSAYSQLRDKYPAYFREGFPDWALSYPLGWHPRVMRLLEEITRSVDAEYLETFRITQIKEKFGGLRLYFQLRPASHSSNNSDDLGDQPSDAPIKIIRELIDAANEDCQRTCEVCGQEGTLKKDRGWWHVRCYPCSRDRA